MAVCEIFLALGFTLNGLCATPEPEAPEPLPASDPAVFDYVKPTPPPPPRVEMPPVVITKEVQVPTPQIVEKPVERVRTKYVQVPVVVPQPKLREPNHLAIAVSSDLRARRQSQRGLSANGALGGGGRSRGGNEDKAASLGDLPSSTAFPPPIGIDPENDRYLAPRRLSTSAVDNSRIVAADRYITGVLEGGVNSQLADQGSVVIQVSRDVFGYHGRNLLVPKGSRLICTYDTADKAGQTRIGLTCGRILLAESRAEIYQLKSHVGDAQGYGGVSGDVDNRWWEKYGSAVVTVGIGAAVQSAVTLSQSSSSGSDSNTSNTLSETGSGISENVGQLSASFLENTVDLKPIIRISQGTRVQIRPEYDWYLADPK